MSARRQRDSQRGSAMLVTLILIASLLAGAAVLVSMQLASNRGSELSRSGMTALYCAEAGLMAARPVVIANSANWDTAVAASNGVADPAEPSWLLSGITSHDLDGDGVADFKVYLRDNDDEVANSATNNLDDDIDGRVFVVSKCLKYPDTPKAISELIELAQGGNLYDWQAGGAFGNNNANYQAKTR